MTKLRQTARQQLEQLLSALFLPGELIELRFIESWLSQGKKQSRVVRSAQWLRCRDVVAMHGDLTAFAKRTWANLYFGVCPRSNEGDADDRSIHTVRCVWCDIDCVSLDQALGRWRDADVPSPSIVVSSGTGIHGYWLLDQDLHSHEDHSRFRAMLPGFYGSFGGDHVQNLSRVMRLPGTLNYKDARNGRQPLPCTLCTCDSKLRYPFETFSRWIAPPEPEPLRKMLIASSMPASEPSADEILSRRTEAAALVGQLAKPSHDRSRRDFAVICDLLRLGLAKEEIWELVAGSSKFQSNGRPYFDLTFSNAERRVLFDGTSAGRVRVPT